MTIKSCKHLLPAFALFSALAASASPITLDLEGGIIYSTFAAIPAGTAFSISITYDPATGPSNVSPGQYQYPLIPGDFTASFQGLGGFSAQTASTKLYTQPDITCFNGVSVPCAKFIVQATLSPADRTGSLFAVPLDAVTIYFEDYSKTLVSAGLPGAPFPDPAAWTVADIFGYQQKEGGASYTGAITSITTTTTTGTPEPSSVTLFIAGLVAFGLAKGSRVQRRVSAIRGAARW